LREQQPPPWQVVTQWVSEGGRESVRINGFDDYDAARREVKRLAESVGKAVGDQVLKSVELAGNFKSVWGRLKQ
jgi:hypothetical protein